MSVYVLDASAIVAYLAREPGHANVAALLADSNAVCYAHTINLCEVYYILIRNTNIRQARQTVVNLFADGLIERRNLGRRFWQGVGEHKARGQISLPDCFCIALAQELSAEVVTADHGEFDRLVPLGIAPINFIR